MIQLLSYQTHQLREAIEQKCQMPIRNQADCILLSNFIEENTGKQVGSHTLRRFFGIVKWQGEFRTKTMDILALIAGFTSINAFLQELRSQADLSAFLKVNDQENSDIFLYEKLIRNSPSIDSIMVVGSNIQSALEQNQIQRVIDLLGTVEPMAKEKQRHYNALMLFAQVVAPHFYKIQEEAIIKRFIQETSYAAIVLCHFVPILDLDASFGKHIQCLLRFSTNPEHLAFGYSLLGANAWRNQDAKKARELTNLAVQNSKEISNIHPILKGRVDFLSRIVHEGIGTALEPSDLRPPKNQRLHYFHAISTEIVLLKQKTWCQLFCDECSLTNDTVNNWIEQSFFSMQEIAHLYAMSDEWTKDEILKQLNEKKTITWPKDLKKVALAMIDIVEDAVQ